ncbi:MAG: twin-arginine translocation signal domain-containing protein [Motiliproteus sp.]
MSKQKPDVSNAERRQFIKTLSVAGGAVVAVAVAGEASAEVVEESTAEVKGAQGYQETDHVRAYYASARI